MHKSTVVTLIGSALAIAALYACSSDSSDGGGGGSTDEGGSAAETGTGADTSMGADGAQQADVVDGAAADAFDASDGSDGFDGNTREPIRCSQAQLDANDLTNMAAVTITFPSNGAPAQYTPNCMKVSKDTVVTFTGAFGSHPLQPFGGDEPSPIPSKNSGTTLDVTMDAAGDYGFRCVFHPGSMFGAVQVVP